MRHRSTVFLIATILILLLAVFLFVPSLQVGYYEKHDPTRSIDAKEAADLENKFRGTLASALGGFVVLLGLWSTFQQLTQASRNARAAEENVKISAKARNLDRLTTAIGYMSSGVMSQRIAGVAILGGVGLYDPEDSEAAIAALISYLPERIPFRNSKEALPPDVAGAFTQLSRLLRNRVPLTDNQLVIRAFDIASCRFTGLYFGQLKFKELNLVDTSFSECSFTDVAFERSANTFAIKFYGCTLTDVYFGGCSLTFAHLQSSRCERVRFAVENLEGGGLTNTAFEDCTFQGVSFKNASLANTSFPRSIITRCDFTKANWLESSDFLSALTLFKTRFPKAIYDKLHSDSEHLFHSPRIIHIYRKSWLDREEFPFYKGRDGFYRCDLETKTTLARDYPGIDTTSLDTVTEHIKRLAIEVRFSSDQ